VKHEIDKVFVEKPGHSGLRLKEKKQYDCTAKNIRTFALSSDEFC